MRKNRMLCSSSPVVGTISSSAQNNYEVRTISCFCLNFKILLLFFLILILENNVIDKVSFASP
jgi:hypothetical protein